MPDSSLSTKHLQPPYPREALRPRLLHLGCGAFHRAHQAVFADMLVSDHASDWGYCEVSLTDSGGTITALKGQDFLYAVAEMDGNDWSCRVVGVVCQALSLREDGLSAVVEALAQPELAVVTLTITEKGYCHSPATGQLQMEHPAIRHDIACPWQPCSAPGVLLAGLRLRRERGLPGLTILSCDNMPANGVVTRQVMMTLASLQDADLAAWVESQVAFPSSMVDCIVPMVTAETRRRIRDLLGGVDDPAGVACEPYRQWVIEDCFPYGRPSWERVGVKLLADVQPFEEMKLRMLNGSHSFLAYLGGLAGYVHVSDCMQDACLVRLVHHLMVEEQAVTLVQCPIKPEEYAAQLLTRFRNPALLHRTLQIAMDGSQQLPQRMLASIRFHLVHGSRFDCLVLGLAAWMCFVSRVDEQGQVISVSDPLAGEIGRLLSSRTDGESAVRALLKLEQVFGTDLPANTHFVELLEQQFQLLQQHGARACIALLCHWLGLTVTLA